MPIAFLPGMGVSILTEGEPKAKAISLLRLVIFDTVFVFFYL